MATFEEKENIDYAVKKFEKRKEDNLEEIIAEVRKIKNRIRKLIEKNSKLEMRLRELEEDSSSSSDY